MLLPLAALLTAALATGQEATTISFPGPVGALKFSPRGGYLIGSDSKKYGSMWLANVSSGSIVFSQPRNWIDLSCDDRFAAGALEDSSVVVIDLRTLAAAKPAMVGRCLFSPVGHLLAGTQHAEPTFPNRLLSGPTGESDGAITLYDADSHGSRTLSRYAANLPKHQVGPFIRVLDWTDRGLNLGVNYGGAADALYILDPQTDRAEATSRMYGGIPPTLLDGSPLSIAPAPDGVQVVASSPSGEGRTIFDSKAAGEPIRSVSLAVASHANRLLAWAISDRPDQQSLWLVNTVTGEAQRILQAKYTPPYGLRFAISNDGEQIAYQSPNDPAKAVVVRAPEFKRHS